MGPLSRTRRSASTSARDLRASTQLPTGRPRLRRRYGTEEHPRRGDGGAATRGMSVGVVMSRQRRRRDPRRVRVAAATRGTSASLPRRRREHHVAAAASPRPGVSARHTRRDGEFELGGRDARVDAVDRAGSFERRGERVVRQVSELQRVEEAKERRRLEARALGEGRRHGLPDEHPRVVRDDPRNPLRRDAVAQQPQHRVYTGLAAADDAVALIVAGDAR